MCSSDLLVSCVVLPLELVLYSFVGAAVLNAVIAWNFRIQQTGNTPAGAAEAA